MQGEKPLHGFFFYDDNWKDLLTTYDNEFITYDRIGNPLTYCDGTRVGFTYNDDAYYYMKNAQGDVTGIIDSDLNVVVEYTYDAWGKLIEITGSDANFIGKLNPFLYRGYYYDAETGLYYLNSRYYDPVTGRFLNADSAIGAEGNLFGSNLFTYCKNNPVALSDSNGYWPTWGQIGMAALTVAIAAVAIVAVVASAGMVGVTLGVAAASIGASGATISAAITVGTIGTYAVAAGTGAFALSNAGEILTGTNLIRDKVMGGNQKAYDAVQAGLAVASAGAVAVGATKPGISGKAAAPSANASKIHKVPTQGTPVSRFEKLYEGKVVGFQRRFYDYKGKVSLDIDFTSHNNPIAHSNPHFHVWDSSGRATQINLW